MIDGNAGNGTVINDINQQSPLRLTNLSLISGP